MSSFICEHCNAEIIDTESGYINGCEHYPKEDFTELSGKQMDNGLSIREADMMAMTLIREQKRKK